MTKKQHREVLIVNLKPMWADPYIKANYTPEIYLITEVVRDMHNRKLNPRRADWARRCTPRLSAQLAHVYETTDLAMEQIAQMYDVNQARVSNAVIGPRT